MTDFDQTEALVRRLFSSVPYARNNHLHIERFAPDDAVLSMDIQPEQLNQHGSLHGGYLILLADCTAGAAALTDGRNYVTQSQSFSFLRAVSGGTIRAAGKVISRGKTLCVVRVEVRDEDSLLIGDGNFNMYAIRRPIEDML